MPKPINVPDDGIRKNLIGTNNPIPMAGHAGQQLYSMAQGQGTAASPLVPVVTPYLGACVYQGRVTAYADSVDCFPDVGTGGGCPGFLNRGLRVQAWTGNIHTVYLGSGFPLSALNGFPMDPGETHFFEIGFPENLCFTLATGIISSGVSGQASASNLLYLGT